MSITSSEKKHAALTLADCHRLLDQAQALQAEVRQLTQQRDALKTVLDHARAVEELPALKAQLEATRTEAAQIREQAEIDAGGIVVVAEEKARGILAEVEATKAKATQEADCLIGDAKRKAILEASEAAAQERRLLVDREARLAAREREVANALRPYREARGHILEALDNLERLPIMGVKTGEA